MIRRFVAALALLAAFGAAGAALGARTSGQTPATPSPSITPAAGTATALIIGRVVDGASGAPVDDAIVTLHILVAPPGNGRPAGQGRSAANKPVPVLVNGRGQFVFRELPAGSMLMTASAPGYMDSGSGVRVPGGGPVAIAIAEGQHPPDVTIRMWRYAAIEGAVFDEIGDPIADVQVRLLQRTAGERRLFEATRATTDDRGAFRFASLDPGRYVVLVQSTTTSLPASVADDYYAQLNENVSPLVRGPVTAAPQPSTPGFRVGDTVLQPATPLARNAPPPTADGHILIFRTTFYPGAATASQAQNIEVAAGDVRTGVNVTLPLVGTVAISGVVSDAGDPIGNLSLALTPAETTDWVDGEGFDAALTTTDADGAFAFLGVPPGQYLIHGIQRSNVARSSEASGTKASSADLAGDDKWVRAPISVGGAPVANLSLVARPGLRVTGRVRFTGSAQPPALGDGFLSLVRLNRTGQPRSIGVTPDGHLSIEGCEPGPYVINVPSLTTNGVSWTVASVTANGRDILTQPLDLESDVSDVVVTFTDQPTRITGSVRSAGLQDEALAVVAFPTDYQAAEDSGLLGLGLRMATVDVTSGRYAVNGLPAGNYLLAAMPASELSVWMNPAVIRSVVSQASAVTISDRSRLTVDLKVIEIR